MAARLIKPFSLGTWANIRYKYMIDHKRADLDRLGNDELITYLESFQDAYQQRANYLQSKLSNERGIDESLFQKNFCEWICQTIKIQEDVRAILTKQIQS